MMANVEAAEVHAAQSEKLSRPRATITGMGQPNSLFPAWRGGRFTLAWMIVAEGVLGSMLVFFLLGMHAAFAWTLAALDILIWASQPLIAILACVLIDSSNLLPPAGQIVLGTLTIVLTLLSMLLIARRRTRRSPHTPC